MQESADGQDFFDILPAFAAAEAAPYLMAAIFTAVSSAISIICVKEVWRSSAVRYCCL